MADRGDEAIRVLLAGWFSIEDGGATAGDVLVRDAICDWLDASAIPYDVAQERSLGPGVDWIRVAPSRYTHLVFACGPVGPDLAVGELIDRFAACRRVAINVSSVGAPSWQPFDLLLERDGAKSARPDLALSRHSTQPPVAAVVRIRRQAEYPGGRPEDAHRAFDRLLASNRVAAFPVDTILDPLIPGRRNAAEVEALIARADIVLTTRLHGLVLALAQGVPALAVDSVPGGAKVIAQARALAWPAATTIDALDDAVLQRHFAWCLTAEARQRTHACAADGRGAIEEIRSTLITFICRR
ncbi:MAG TPA: polysaccharide pyruvyl transferase family protein [Solirubrobacteraceae bacterium]